MRNRHIAICFLTLLALCFAACSAYQNYGRFVPSAEVEQAFARYEVRPELRYYISGPDLFPNALLGLHRDYRLSPGSFWREVSMNPQRMKETIENMKAQAWRFRHFNDGYRLVDHQGRSVGVWFSIHDALTFLYSQGDGTLTIDTPPIDVYLKMDKDGDIPVN